MLLTARRLRPVRLRRPGRHPVERRRDAGRRRVFRLCPRPRRRALLVGRLSADGGEAGQYDVELRAGPRDVSGAWTPASVALEMDVASQSERRAAALTLTNHSGRPRRLEVTSYLEWVLQDAAADAAHPAFSKLFVETEIVARAAIDCGPATAAATRARRVLAGGHWIACVDGGATARPVEFETSRPAFVGRGRSLRSPAAHGRRSRASREPRGPVLDPIASLRRAFFWRRMKALSIVFALAAGRDRATLLELMRITLAGRGRQSVSRPTAVDAAGSERRRRPPGLRSPPSPPLRSDSSHDGQAMSRADYVALRDAGANQLARSAHGGDAAAVRQRPRRILRRRATSMSFGCDPTPTAACNCRRCHGATWSPIPTRGLSRPKRAPATPGPSTAARTG